MYKRKINDISDNVTEADLYIQSLLCIKIFTEYFSAVSNLTWNRKPLLIQNTIYVQTIKAKLVWVVLINTRVCGGNVFSVSVYQCPCVCVSIWAVTFEGVNIETFSSILVDLHHLGQV